MRKFFVLVAGLLVSSAGLAHVRPTNNIIINDPDLTSEWVGCTVTDFHLARQGTVVAIVAKCTGGPHQEKQDPSWLPEPHPDGGIILFQSVVIVNGSAHLECNLLNYNLRGSISLDCLVPSE